MTKTEDAGALANTPREPHISDVCYTPIAEEKSVSLNAVKSVADQYGINSTIFMEWLVMKGFQILEEA